MPFTPTHMLAVFPMVRPWASPGIFTALVIGSMIPDWPLYFPVGPGYYLTHSLTGIFIACLPLGLACTLLFLVAGRRSLIELAPPGLQQRLVGYLSASPVRSARDIVNLAAAVCVGSATHIVWDAFTHAGTWAVDLFPSLNEVWVTVYTDRFVGYMTLQHGSSLIGLPLMIVLFFRWYRRASCQPTPVPTISPLARWIWILLLVGFPIAAMVRNYADVPRPELRPIMAASYYGVTEAGFALIILIACYSLLFYPVASYRQANKA